MTSRLMFAETPPPMAVLFMLVPPLLEVVEGMNVLALNSLSRPDTSKWKFRFLTIGSKAALTIRSGNRLGMFVPLLLPPLSNWVATNGLVPLIAVGVATALEDNPFSPPRYWSAFSIETPNAAVLAAW